MILSFTGVCITLTVYKDGQSHPLVCRYLYESLEFGFIVAPSWRVSQGRASKPAVLLSWLHFNNKLWHTDNFKAIIIWTFISQSDKIVWGLLIYTSTQYSKMKLVCKRKFVAALIFHHQSFPVFCCHFSAIPAGQTIKSCFLLLCVGFLFKAECQKESHINNPNLLWSDLL